MAQTKTADTPETAQFRATAGAAQAFGLTPQDALAALMQRLPAAPEQPIVIWPFNRGDAFWSDAQQERLQELKARRAGLSVSEKAELDALVASAFDATADRTRSLPLVKS